MNKKLLCVIITVIGTMTMQAQGEQVMRAEIPSGAKHFLSKYFRSPFHHAIRGIEEDVITYDIVLNDKTKIEFSEAGIWKEIDGKGKTIPCKFLQKEILDYVSTKYPNETITKIGLNESNYNIKLSNGHDLVFDFKGFCKND
jgi:hypothetical protein